MEKQVYRAGVYSELAGSSACAQFASQASRLENEMREREGDEVQAWRC